MKLFLKEYPKEIPENLKLVTVLGVDYIWGHTESTGGRLWVVGRDPDLFDFFLPERWETCPRTRLSYTHQIYYSCTKDNINIVWAVSNVGLIPDFDPFREEERLALDFGYNSPFEEVAFAVDLSRKGIRTVYPRAIYMYGGHMDISESIIDESRYISHKSIVDPEGQPVLRKKYRYIIIWGYWNGPDEKLAVNDGDFFKAASALQASRERKITRELYFKLMEKKKKKLAGLKIRDLNFRGSHLLVSWKENNKLLLDNTGFPDTRVCSFELLKWMQ